MFKSVSRQCRALMLPEPYKSRQILEAHICVLRCSILPHLCNSPSSVVVISGVTVSSGRSAQSMCTSVFALTGRRPLVRKTKQ